MHVQPSGEDLIELTKLNRLDRFLDRRTQVPDDVREWMKLVSTEEAAAVLTAGSVGSLRAIAWRFFAAGSLLAVLSLPNFCHIGQITTMLLNGLF